MLSFEVRMALRPNPQGETGRGCSTHENQCHHLSPAKGANPASGRLISRCLWAGDAKRLSLLIFAPPSANRLCSGRNHRPAAVQAADAP
jgi:hypothetical protein